MSDEKDELKKQAYQRIVDLMGRKTKVDSELATLILHLYYSVLGYKQDTRGDGLLSPTEQTKVVLSGRNIQIFGGGRGKWRKVESVSKISAAETFLARAKDSLGLATGAIQELKEKRKGQVEKKVKKEQSAAWSKVVQKAAAVVVSQEMKPEDKVLVYSDAEARRIFLEAVQERAASMGTMAVDLPAEQIEVWIAGQLTVNNPPILLEAPNYPEEFRWEEDSFPIMLKVNQHKGIIIQIGDTTIPVDPFTMRLTMSFWASSAQGASEGGSDGYVSGAIHTGGAKPSQPAPALFMITSNVKGAGTRMLRLFCKLIRGLGMKYFVAQGVLTDGAAFFNAMHKRGEIDVLSRGTNWVITCSKADLSQMDFPFPPA